jgi:hypothetical protein
MHRINSRKATRAAALTKGTPSSPKGSRTPPRPGIDPGLRAMATLVETSTAPESHAKGRHLLDASLPSGESRSRKVPRSPAEGTHNQLPSPASTTG